MKIETSRAIQEIELFADNCEFRQGDFCLHSGDPSGIERGTRRCLPFVQQQIIEAHSVTINYLGAESQKGTIVENPRKAALSDNQTIIRNRLCDGFAL